MSQISNVCQLRAGRNHLKQSLRLRELELKCSDSIERNPFFYNLDYLIIFDLCHVFFKQTKKKNTFNWSMFRELRKISKIQHFANTDCAALLVSSLLLSKLDYCNCLLAGLPSERLKRLQTVQNKAARLVLNQTKRDFRIPLLETLHWLPVEKRISYKLATMFHKCIYGKAPSYLTNIL